MSRRKLGFQRERNLVKMFWKHGFACMRAPASGAKTRRVIYPDIVAMKDGVIFVIEVKTREKTESIYIERGKIERLTEFADRAGGYAYIAVRFLDRPVWLFIPAEKLRKTKTGNYCIDSNTLKEALTFKELIRKHFNTKLGVT